MSTRRSGAVGLLDTPRAWVAPVTTTRAFVEHIMGMPISVHVRAVDPARADIAAAVANVFAHLRKVDAVFSVWRPDSAVLRLRRGELDSDGAHPWVAEVQALCADAAEITGGLFASWLTGPDGTTGWDPTGLVKGWGVQGATAHLRELPEVAFAVNAGGDIVCGLGRGSHELADLWRIGIEDPAERTRLAGDVQIVEGALATSGTAARGAHIIDPRTGAPMDRAGSVTVTGPDLTWVDVWATACFLDPQALDWAHRRGQQSAYSVALAL